MKLRPTVAVVKRQRASIRAAQAQVAQLISEAFAQAATRSAKTVADFVDSYATKLARVQGAQDGEDDAPSGAKVSLAWLPSQGGLRTLQATLRTHAQTAATYTAAYVQQGQTRIARLAELNAEALIGSFAPSGTKPTIVPTPQSKIGASVAGGSVSDYLDDYGDRAWNMCGKAANGVAATGGSGDDMRKAIDAVLLGLTVQSLLVSDTELAGLYRVSVADTMAANPELTGGWIWWANLGSACIACTDMHGTFYTWDVDMMSHLRCECEMVPSPAAVGPEGEAIDFSDVEDGRTWLENQPDYIQRGIMGPSKYLAWKSGDVSDLSDFVDTSSGLIAEASLKSLGLDASDYIE